MNYIKRLEMELQEARTELTGLRCGLDDLRGYLMMPKFWQDTTVQVSDVLHRLRDAEDLAMDLLTEQQAITARNEVA